MNGTRDEFLKSMEKLIQKSGSQSVMWEGSMREYLALVAENPQIAQSAPARIYDMIASKGTKEPVVSLRLPHYEDLVLYNFFSGEIFGIEESLHDLVRFFRAGANRTETGKRILILVGPVSSGKSTIATLLRSGLERLEVPVYAVKGCPIHEEPLHLIPRSLRGEFEKLLGVKIEGDLCPVCKWKLENEPREGGPEGHFSWEDMPVVQTSLSERDRVGIGTFQPSDPKNQDISELIGHVDLGKITKYGEAHPLGYKFDGEIEIANRGLIEYIEILKCDIKFHYVLITVAQEQVIKAPGFPQIYIDTVILSHTNQTEFDKFKASKENEALHDRMYPIYVPYNLRIRDEVSIYKKLTERSEFHGKVHIAPFTFETAAMFAVLTRLMPSNLCPELVKKARYYDGQVIMEKEKDPVSVKKMRLEGREKAEGMSGISPRFVMNAINIALGSALEGAGCINPVDIIRALTHQFEHHIGFTDEEKARYIELLKGEKGSALSEYRDEARREVNRAFLFAYEDQAQALFENYMKNAVAFCLKRKTVDPVTQEEQEPDEKLMRSIEEMIGISEMAKREFRQGLFVFKSDALDRGEKFNFDTYLPLQEGIEKKLMADLRNIVSLTLADENIKDPKKQKRREDALSKLMEKGYCAVCANNLLHFVGEMLRKEG
ncbi:MAG: protein prkA [Deltaproteobacteria bacterium]|jgi:serine protein kinase|nr:protein prkA [Deltaproteobacteria bacterium]